jgi:hypothetical protein
METMNTDTPETDGEWNRLSCQDGPEFERNLADFARKLERERDEAREKCANLHDIAERMIEYVGHTAAYEKLRAELDKHKEDEK